jgi:addiction module HigA family antidote
MHSTLRSWITTREVEMAPRKMPPVHPGEILMEEFLEPMEISQYRLSKDIGVPPRRINEIVHGKRAISPDTALRLSRYFAMSETFCQTSKLTMNWKWSGIVSATGSRRKSGYTLGLASQCGA